VRFITTQAFSGRNKVVLVVDGEEDGSPDKTDLGEEFFLDEELQCVLTGREPDLVSLFADEFGVWLSKSEPLRDGEGRIVAAVAVDVPALDGVEMVGHVPFGPSSVVDAASARFLRAEIDSITDGLTGLYNHRYLHERLGEEVSRAAKDGTELSLLFLDLDHFKQYNDRRGHSAGDRALRAVARVVERSVRRIDLVGRYGGEEFVVVLPESGTPAALEAAERIRRAVEEAEGSVDGQGLTVSIGVATFPADARSKEELLDRADWSMYRAKRAGRNRVVAFVSEPMGAMATAASCTQKESC
jgi:diguanylate cyclase (GGDEF)-like protein